MKAFAFSKRRELLRRVVNRLMFAFITVGAFLAVTPLFLILFDLIEKGAPHVNWVFLSEIPRPLGEEGGGVANGIVGSLVVVGFAALLGVPFGVGLGLFLSEYKSTSFTKLVRLFTDILASVPTILIGLFAYALLVQPFHRFSALSASFALAVIMIPLVARSTEEILVRTPSHVREAGLALGLPRWKVTLRIVFRGSLSGVTTAVVLALARVAGETAPMLYTAFGNTFGFKGLMQPVATLPTQIFEYAISPYESLQKMAWAAAFLLVFSLVVINLFMRLLMARNSSEF